MSSWPEIITITQEAQIKIIPGFESVTIGGEVPELLYYMKLSTLDIDILIKLWGRDNQGLNKSENMGIIKGILQNYTDLNAETEIEGKTFQVKGFLERYYKELLVTCHDFTGARGSRSFLGAFDLKREQRTEFILAPPPQLYVQDRLGSRHFNNEHITAIINLQAAVLQQISGTNDFIGDLLINLVPFYYSGEMRTKRYKLNTFTYPAELDMDEVNEYIKAKEQSKGVFETQQLLAGAIGLEKHHEQGDIDSDVMQRVGHAMGVEVAVAGIKPQAMIDKKIVTFKQMISNALKKVSDLEAELVSNPGNKGLEINLEKERTKVTKFTSKLEGLERQRQDPETPPGESAGAEVEALKEGAGVLAAAEIPDRLDIGQEFGESIRVTPISADDKGVNRYRIKYKIKIPASREIVEGQTDKRFSEILTDLHDQPSIKVLDNDSAPFPPKTWGFGLNPTQLENRRGGLETYMNNLLDKPEARENLIVFLEVGGGAAAVGGGAAAVGGGAAAVGGGAERPGSATEPGQGGGYRKRKKRTKKKKNKKRTKKRKTKKRKTKKRKTKKK